MCVSPIRRYGWEFGTDLQSLSEEEQKVFRLYGKLPDRKDLLANKLKVRVALRALLTT